MLLLLIPMIGILLISAIPQDKGSDLSIKYSKVIALATSMVNFFISILIYIIFNLSSNQFQFVQEYHKISNFDFYLGIDGISIYFVLLTTVIIPVSLLSN